MNYHQMPEDHMRMYSRRPETRKKQDCAVEAETDYSYTVGETGPVLLEDTMVHETLETFVHSKRLERAVHVKGFGAFGYFQTYQSMAAVTSAGFLQSAGKRTPVATRFSLAVSTKGTPDTSRNVRGFATKFYTDEGNFDLLCNHIPVFLVRDAMRFPDSIKSFLPSPVNNLSYAERFWDFVAKTPETLHFVSWLYSDWGTVKSLRHIRGFGVNTYAWKNAKDERRFVKYHWIPMAGVQYIDRQEATALAGQNPDVCGQDLYNAIAQGQKVEYELCVQLMDPCDAHKLSYDPLDCTKIWDEKIFPLIPVGRLVLNKNPEDYDSQVEKLAFSPANLVEGVEFTNDKMLQGRSTVYWDAQRYRLGPDFRSIPVNHDECFDPKKLVTSGEGLRTSGIQQRTNVPKPNNFEQAGLRYRSLSVMDKDHLIDNMAVELATIPQETADCVIGYFNQADSELGMKLQMKTNAYMNKR